MATPFNSYSFYNSIIAGKLWDYECAKFRGSHTIASLVGQVLSCHCAYMGRKYFFVGISWVSSFFWLVFRWCQIYSRWYFMGPLFILVGIS